MVPPGLDIDEWLLEGKQMKGSPLVVARTLVKLWNNTVLVRLLNPDTLPFTLHKKSKIAITEPFDGINVSATGTTNTEITPTLTNEKRPMLWNMVCNYHTKLSVSEREDLFHLLCQFREIFVTPQEPLGRTSKLKHSINTSNAHPIRQPTRRIPTARRSEVTKLLEETLEKDIIKTIM